MSHRAGMVFGVVLLVALPNVPAQGPNRESKQTISETEKLDLQARIEHLDRTIRELQGKFAGDQELSPGDALADVAIQLKAARWILQHNEFFARNSVAQTVRVLERGEDRSEALKLGRHPWTIPKGGVTRGFASRIDGSLQPYAVYVPENYDAINPMRLDVILHGREATLTEVKFLELHEGKPMPPGESGLILHVFGRGNNAYRWAGETDVFEAIDAVKRNYRVDDRRIVLRGFSMGGAGAWHLGLHHPDRWCAVEAGAGFAETREYARLGTLSEVESQGLHIYDAADYARNAWNVPIAGYGGEIDPQRRASEVILEALERIGVATTTDGLVTRARGLDFLRVVGANTAHAVDPASRKILKAFRDEHAATGRNSRPKSLRFSTWTLKYNACDWVTIEALTEPRRQAVVEAEVREDVAVFARVDNVALIGVNREVAESIELGSKIQPLRQAVGGLLPMVFFRPTEEGWIPLDYDQSRAFQVNQDHGKRHNLQGPIDDAFTGPFLCVRPTGTPWNPNVDRWALGELDRFAAEWSEFFRADLPIKDDKDVSAEDLGSKHLILFGDPGSNTLIARALPELPLTWSRTEVAPLGSKNSFPAADHAPTLILAAPWNPLRYVVLNSGTSYGPDDLRGTNAKLYPRLGDWGIFRVGNQTATIVTSGFYDNRWDRPRNPRLPR